VFLFVEKNTNKKLTGYAKLAKELKASRITKTLAKIFLPPTALWVVWWYKTVLFFIAFLEKLNFTTQL
jgi:hypothetical protein